VEDLESALGERAHDSSDNALGRSQRGERAARPVRRGHRLEGPSAAVVALWARSIAAMKRELSSVIVPEKTLSLIN